MYPAVWLWRVAWAWYAVFWLSPIVFDCLRLHRKSGFEVGVMRRVQRHWFFSLFGSTSDVFFLAVESHHAEDGKKRRGRMFVACISIGKMLVQT